MSEQTSRLAACLAAAQVEIADPARGRQGAVRGRANYRYAGLDDLLQAVRPVLGRHGLAVTSRIVVTEVRRPLGWALAVLGRAA